MWTHPSPLHTGWGIVTPPATLSQPGEPGSLLKSTPSVQPTNVNEVPGPTPLIIGNAVFGEVTG